MDIATTIKSLSAVNDNGVLLHKSEAEALGDYIRKMEYMAGIGETYLRDLKAEVLKSCSIAKPELKKDVMESVCDKMSIDCLLYTSKTAPSNLFQGVLCDKLPPFL